MFLPRHVIVPGTERDLLRKELAGAFRGLGCRVSIVDPARLHDASDPLRLPELLDGSPSLLFSVNFCGLSPLRPSLELLHKSHSRIALWFVDNPWNILAGVRDPRWRQLPLFVTDASFIAPLRANGAEQVHHLPLASAPEFFSPVASSRAALFPPGERAPFVFVGRSAFPGKETFFAGQSLPESLQKKAEAELRQGGRPDLNWWEQQLRLAPADFWPGKKARLPALGAETANLDWRILCLEQAAEAGQALGKGAGLEVFGDTGWKDLLSPGCLLRPPVDYYSRLPALYAQARYSLCLTSLQLPQGLNQRHFDIWTAGGLCLTDAAPGLALFPEELTRPISFRSPKEIPSLARGLEISGARDTLIADWRSHLAGHHTYAHRVQTLLRRLDAGTRKIYS